jgi:ribosomal protein S18 acetylase RimI-like enzyme
MTLVIEGDITSAEHAAALVQLLDEYARDPMGGGRGLSDYTRTHLVPALLQRSDFRCVLAFAGEQPVGLITGFEGFSTFACKPLLNIHDVVVSENFRGQGICRKMFERLEELATARGYCKLTLEVLEGNRVAREAYRALGFGGYELDPAVGQAMFWQKKLAAADGV